MSRNREVLFLWLPVLLCMVAIFTASALPNPPAPPDVSDVSLHTLAYFGLTLTLIRALARGTWAGVTLRALALAFVVAVAYGVTDEWHQMYVPNRHAELRDLRSDAVGAALAVVGVKAWSIIRRL